MNKNIILIGMSRVGKTTIGKTISDRYNISLHDTDKIITQQFNLNIQKVLSTIGRNKFRALEFQILNNLLQKQTDYSIIATGGGTIEYPNTVKILAKEPYVVFLNASVPYIFNRVLQEVKSTQKPPTFLSCSFNTMRKSFSKLYNRRLTLYKRVCKFEINIEDKNLTTLCNEIADLIF